MVLFCHICALLLSVICVTNKSWPQTSNSAALQKIAMEIWVFHERQLAEEVHVR